MDYLGHPSNVYTGTMDATCGRIVWTNPAPDQPERQILLRLEQQRRRESGTRRVMLALIERYLCRAWRDR